MEDSSDNALLDAYANKVLAELSLKLKANEGFDRACKRPASEMCSELDFAQGFGGMLPSAMAFDLAVLQVQRGRDEPFGAMEQIERNYAALLPEFFAQPQALGFFQSLPQSEAVKKNLGLILAQTTSNDKGAEKGEVKGQPAVITYKKEGEECEGSTKLDFSQCTDDLVRALKWLKEAAAQPSLDSLGASNFIGFNFVEPHANLVVARMSGADGFVDIVQDDLRFSGHNGDLYKQQLVRELATLDVQETKVTFTTRKKDPCNDAKAAHFADRFRKALELFVAKIIEKGCRATPV